MADDLPPGFSAAPPVDTPKPAKQPQGLDAIHAWFKEKGNFVNPHAADALASVSSAETGGDPYAANKAGSGAIGGFQWLGPRKKEFIQSGQYDPPGQAQFAMKELSSGRYPRSWSKLNDPNASVDDIRATLIDEFEAPGGSAARGYGPAGGDMARARAYKPPKAGDVQVTDLPPPEAKPAASMPPGFSAAPPSAGLPQGFSAQPPGPQDPSIIARTPAPQSWTDTVKHYGDQVLQKLKDPELLAKGLGKVGEYGERAVDAMLTPAGPLDPLNAIPNREKLVQDVKAYLFEGGNVASLRFEEPPKPAEAPQIAGAPKSVAEPLKATGTDPLGQSVTTAGPPPNEASIAARERLPAARKLLDDASAKLDALPQDMPYKDKLRATQKIISQRDDAIRALGRADQPAAVGAKPAPLHELAAQDLGAGGTPKAVIDHFNAVPATPSKDYIRSTDDGFFRLRQSATADRQQAMEFLKSLPDEMRDPAIQQKLYEFGEPGTNIKLEPKEQELFDKYIRPWKVEESELWKEAQKINGESKVGMKDLDPEYMHRMVKGKTNELDRWSGEGSAASPQSGYRSLKAPSQKERKYLALISEDGTRKLLHVTPEGTFVIEKGKSTPLPRYEGSATEVGDKLTSGGKRYEVGQANTREIEANTATRYYKNAAAATVKNTLQLRAVVRAQYELERLKSTPEFAKYARPVGAERPEGWRSPNMPMFSRYWMEPKLADVIDDFWGRRGQDGVLGALAKINRFAVNSLFYSPIPHAMNAAAHWVTARGWSNVTPTGYLSLALDGAKAIREVVTQGKEYQRMLREGSGLVYGSVANEEFYRSMLKSLGESVQREPFKWDPIAKALGVGPSDVVRMLYGASSRALWAASDMMMLQHVFELERRGLSAREAIRQAEKHIPNYRISPQVLGSRAIAQVLKDPNLTEFSRYHYGQIASIGHMAKDLAVGTPQEKFEAMGSILATGALMLWVWPLINEQIQRLSGDDKLELGPKGSTTIPSAVRDWWQGKKELSQVIQGSITLSPVIRMGIEEFFNRDMFTGKNIREPYDEQQHRLGRTAAQSAEHIAGNVVSPYGTAERGMIGRRPEGAAKELMKQGLGLRKTPQVYKGKSYQGTPAQQAAFRRAHPRGSIEEFEKWLENKYGGTQ